LISTFAEPSSLTQNAGWVCGGSQGWANCGKQAGSKNAECRGDYAMPHESTSS
jgi:hypothetical protein